jgi:hypothetical protein
MSLKFYTHIAKQVAVQLRKRGGDEIMMMHIRNDSSVDWIVENFEVLNHAKVYAALLYYYKHKEEIDTILDNPEPIPEDAMTLEKFKAKVAARQRRQSTTPD